MKKTFVISIFICFILAISMPVYAQDESAHPPRVVDDAYTLTPSEVTALTKKLDEISLRNECDIVVHTTREWIDGRAMQYADDFYDYNGYGIDDENSGIILVVSTTSRDWWISTTGFGIYAVTDAGLDYLSDQFLPDLKDGDYYSAFVTFAEVCDDMIACAEDGKPYDEGNLPKDTSKLFVYIPIAIGIGVLIAFIAVRIMAGKLKSVKMQSNAKSYFKQNSFLLTNHSDRFLYTTVRAVPIPKDTGSSSGGTHTGSSGTSHGGGGGKF